MSNALIKILLEIDKNPYLWIVDVTLLTIVFAMSILPYW